MGSVVVGASNRVVVSLARALSVLLCFVGATRGDQPALGPGRVLRSLSASLRGVASVLCGLSHRPTRSTFDEPSLEAFLRLLSVPAYTHINTPQHAAPARARP